MKIITCFILNIFLIFHGVAQIRLAQDWEKSYSARFPNEAPVISHNSANENGEYAWNAHYWIRAFISMADLTSEKIYIERALKLSEKLIRNRDDNRRLNLNREPYIAAPMPLLQTNKPAAGWRRRDSYYNGWRVFLIEDAQITQAITRLINFIDKDPRFKNYSDRTNKLYDEIQKTVQMHSSSFRYNRFQKIPGSFYYPDTSGNRLFSGAVEFNMNAAMATVLLLLHRVNPDSSYFNRANSILEYFYQILTIHPDLTISWPYQPQNPGYGTTKSGVEDFNHAHMVIGFLLECRNQRLNVPDKIMDYLARTLTSRIYLEKGELAWAIDGSETSEFKNFWPIAFDWIELSQFDPQICTIAREVYEKHYPEPSWGRDFLGWAEILRWESNCRKPQAK